jgi:hypothetical protein
MNLEVEVRMLERLPHFLGGLTITWRGSGGAADRIGSRLARAAGPGGNYVSVKTVRSMVYLAGVISSNSEGVITGTAGLDLSIDEAYAAARACVLTQLAVLRDIGGRLTW